MAGVSQPFFYFSLHKDILFASLQTLDDHLALLQYAHQIGSRQDFCQRLISIVWPTDQPNLSVSDLNASDIPVPK